MEWAKNWVTDKLAGYAATGIQAGGNLAGNAVGGVGTLIENSGRSVGQSANGPFPYREFWLLISDFRYFRRCFWRWELH